MTDAFEDYGKSLTSPGEAAMAIEPSDEVTFNATRALWVGTPGDLVVKMKKGSVVTFPNAQGMMSLRITQLLVGTNAEDVVAIW